MSGNKNDLDYEGVQLLAMDAHGAHDIEQIEAGVEDSSQLDGTCVAGGELGKRAMGGMNTGNWQHVVSCA